MIENREMILNEGETYFVEFMKDIDEGLPEELCAFANASGGRVFIGITDDGFVSGTEISNKARAVLHRMAAKVEPVIGFSISVDLNDNVFIISVNEGKSKPYSAPSGYYLRVGAGKIRLAREELVEYILREGGMHYDEIVRGDLPLAKKFDDAAYSKYMSAAGISKSLSREVALKHLRCAAGAGDKHVFTNAGAMFFRHNKDEEAFEHNVIVCVLYRGLTRSHILDRQRFDSDIVSNIDNTILFLKRNLRSRYEAGPAGGREILELPEVALKEAIANAVCHRDYFEKGVGIMVEVYNDRVEIASPGGAPAKMGGHDPGHIGIRRNPVISGMLRRINYVGETGSGIRRIREEAAEAGVAEPVFKTDMFFKVVFKRPEFFNGAINLSANTSSCPQENGLGNPSANPSVSITKKEREVLNIINDNNNITVNEIAGRLGRSRTAISDRISVLKKKGFLRREGADKNGYWEII